MVSLAPLVTLMALHSVFIQISELNLNDKDVFP